MLNRDVGVFGKVCLQARRVRVLMTKNWVCSTVYYGLEARGVCAHACLAAM